MICLNSPSRRGITGCNTDKPYRESFKSSKTESTLIVCGFTDFLAYLRIVDLDSAGAINGRWPKLSLFGDLIGRGGGFCDDTNVDISIIEFEKEFANKVDDVALPKIT